MPAWNSAHLTPQIINRFLEPVLWHLYKYGILSVYWLGTQGRVWDSRHSPQAHHSRLGSFHFPLHMPLGLKHAPSLRSALTAPSASPQTPSSRRRAKLLVALALQRQKDNACFLLTITPNCEMSEIFLKLFLMTIWTRELALNLSLGFIKSHWLVGLRNYCWNLRGYQERTCYLVFSHCL